MRAHSSYSKFKMAQILHIAHPPVHPKNLDSSRLRNHVIGDHRSPKYHRNPRIGLRSPIVERNKYSKYIKFYAVRALASHQCGPGSIPRLVVICGLSLLLVLVIGFSPGTPVLPSPQTPTLLNSNSIWKVSPIKFFLIFLYFLT